MKILFYSNGSLQSERAVRFAAPLAEALEAEVHVLGITAKEEGEEALKGALRAIQDICLENHLKADSTVKVGKPGAELVNYSQANFIDLVVIGGERHNPIWRALDPLWKSERSYKIVRAVGANILLVLGKPAKLQHILLCTDGSEALERAVEFTGRTAHAVKAKVDLLLVLPELPKIYADLVELDEHVDRLLESDSDLGQILRRQKDLLKQQGVFGRFKLRHGLLPKELKKELQNSTYDLVACGSSPAKERLRSYIRKDVTRDIINISEIPVLIIRTGQKTFMGYAKEFLAQMFRRSVQKAKRAKD